MTRTDRSIIAQLIRESCDYLRDSFTTATFEPFTSRDEPYLSDSSIDDDFATTRLLSTLTYITYDADFTSDAILPDFIAALRDHTLIRDLSDELRTALAECNTDPDTDCACAIFTFQTELITRPCPHDD